MPEQSDSPTDNRGEAAAHSLEAIIQRALRRARRLIVTPDPPNVRRGLSVGMDAVIRLARGRPKGSGPHVTADAPLIREGEEMMAQEPGLGPWAAANRLVDKAAGGAIERESKAQRLYRRLRDRRPRQ